MNKFVASRIRAVRGNDVEKARAAILDLAMLLEHARSSVNGELRSFDTCVDDECRRQLLTAGEQGEVVRELASVVKNRESRIEPSIIWAIGKGQPMASVKALLELITRDVARMDSESTYQLLIAFHDALEFADAEHIPIFQQMLAADDPTGFLSGATRDRDRRIAERALDALNEVQRFVKGRST